jgi:hypothetical protein
VRLHDFKYTNSRGTTYRDVEEFCVISYAALEVLASPILCNKDAASIVLIKPLIHSLSTRVKLHVPELVGCDPQLPHQAFQALTK